MNYEQQLLAIAQADERIVVMTAENRAAIRNLPAKLGNRFIDVGIAEQTMIGAAAGLALRGRIPVVHALATFLTLRAFEFIRTDIGIGRLPVVIVGGVHGFLSEANGPTHQAIEDIALMRGIPGMGVFCPSDSEELVAALPQIVASAQPYYIRYYSGEPVVMHSAFALGKAEVFWSCYGAGAADDVAILTYGFLLEQALEAQQILQSNGLSVRVVNLRTLSPIDRVAIVDAATSAELLVTLEDHFVIGGLFSIVSELLVRERILPNVFPIALEQRWFKPALLQDVLEYEGFTSEAIARRIAGRLEAADATADVLTVSY